MIKYVINGQLYFGEGYQITLKTPLSYQREKDVEVLIRGGPENNCLDVILKLVSDSKESAIILAENELERLSNLISWFHNIPVVRWKINGITSLRDESSQNVVFMTGIGSLSAKATIMKTLGDESIKNLEKKLVKSYTSDFEEILIMWRQALAEESRGLKFFLLYQILEKLCGNRSNVDNFIKSKITNVEMRNNGRNNKVTIFTFLRDNIHPKTSKFPYNEIEKYLTQIQDLVRKKIEEDFYSDLFV
jgi:hypothetical protein